MAADQEGKARLERLEAEVGALATLALRLVESRESKQPLSGMAFLREVVEDLEAKRWPAARPALRIVEDA